ncbi:Acyl carrier protein [Hyunsoonleella jejuensis]|uniref:Acyl carrier protein n=1 Tax=Hyunsoonleella jejuensis TaxID=419940 RepID=A0A1H9KJG9_9FLAO|nr:acyl carrier protein [Hyunsoonleella jejuensis]SEQ99055.1 Acyl carrier protein [Hyunsoonleella jejuensis]
MKQIILEHIENELLVDELDEKLESDTDLLGSAILDSLGMVQLISFVENKFEIKVNPEDMVIENFMTVDDIVNFINTKQ